MPYLMTSRLYPPLDDCRSVLAFVLPHCFMTLVTALFPWLNLQCNIHALGFIDTPDVGGHEDYTVAILLSSETTLVETTPFTSTCGSAD